MERREKEGLGPFAAARAAAIDMAMRQGLSSGRALALAMPGMSGTETCESLVVVLDGIEHAVPWEPGDTIVQAAWAAGVRPPISCLSGSCATCMAKLVEGQIEMLHNDVLSDAEIAAGYVLTCQSVPTARRVKVVYED